MSPKTLVVGLVAVGCIGAAGLGGYLAVREGSLTSAAAPASQTPPAPTAAAAADAEAPAAAPAPTSGVVGPAAPRRTEQTRAARPAVARQEPVRSRPSARVETPEPAPAAPRPTEPTEIASEPVAVESTSSVQDRPAAGPEPATPAFDELTVAENAVIGIRLESPVSTETSRVEDRVTARVTRDVLVDGRTAIPAGATLEGAVSLVQPGGSFKERARIGIRFTTMILSGNTRLPIRTETIFREGEAPGGEATSKIGASAVVGAILGAVVGGKKGAAIGGTAGAAGGTAVVMAGGPNAAAIPAGTPLTVRLVSPVSVQVPRDEP